MQQQSDLASLPKKRKPASVLASNDVIYDVTAVDFDVDNSRSVVIDADDVLERYKKNPNDFILSKNHSLMIEKSALKKLMKKHKISASVSVEEAMENAELVADIERILVPNTSMYEEAGVDKSIISPSNKSAELLCYDEKINAIIDKSDAVLTKLVTLNNESEKKILEADKLVEQFDAQRKAVQATEVASSRSKFKTIVDAYEKQAEKGVADARAGVASIKDLANSDLTSIKKEIKALIRDVTKQFKQDDQIDALLKKANNVVDVIEIQRKQILTCAEKNEKNLTSVKIKFSDYKKSYNSVLDGIGKPKNPQA